MIERDREYIFGYPPTAGKIDADEIWKNTPEKKEIAFYIHIPFCKSICKYCPFNKYLRSPEVVGRYISALKKEIDMVARQSSLQHALVIAGYFGGGTPTCLSGEQLSDIMGYCYKSFTIASQAEISIEANPDTIDGEKLEALLRAGINRISFGVQSFDDGVLEMLGCNHRSQQAVNALNLAFNAGFTNVGIDLLYRIPGQTPAAWESQLKFAKELDLAHITTPELSIDPGTKLYEESSKGIIPPQPGEEQTIAMYKRGCEILTGSGYHHYLMGYDFSLKGKECLYHRMSWQAPQKEVVGLGAGAYSYVNGAAYFNMAPLNDYIVEIQNNRLPLASGKKLSMKEKMARYMVHGVYFVRISKKNFADQFEVEMDEVYGDVLKKLAGSGLITNGRDEWMLTPEGKIYVNNVSKAFYGEEYAGGSSWPA